MTMQRWLISGAIGLGIALTATPGFADTGDGTCSGLPSQSALQTALSAAVGPGNGGLGFNMWASIAANDGTVCAVAFTGSGYTDQWLGSRVISAQKANTANDCSLGEGSHMPAVSLFQNGLALSTANLYSAVQPGGSLYGLQHSNPVDVENDVVGVCRITRYATHGAGCRPEMVEVEQVPHPPGDHVVGAGGVAADPDAADLLPAGLQQREPAAITPTANGGMLNPSGTLSHSAGGFGHPTCLNNPDPSTLPPVRNP